MDKLHVYTMTHNEEYMITHFLRYYEKVADKIFVIDDGSTDRTVEIIKNCSKATVLPYPFKSGLLESDKTMCFQTIYKEHSLDAEWVITADCDEFVFHPDLRNFLDAKRAEGRRAIKTTGVFLAGTKVPDVNTEDFFAALPYRKFYMTYNKSIVFDPKLTVDFGGSTHPPVKFTDENGNAVEHGQCGLYLYHCCYLSKKWIFEHLTKRAERLLYPLYKTEEAYARALKSYTKMVPLEKQDE